MFEKEAEEYGMQIASMGVEVEVVNAYEDFNKNDGGELTPDEVEIIKKELGI